MKKVVFMIIGCVTLILGAIGTVLPILPSCPFFMVTLFCFANSSQRLHDWFVQTRLYKNNLESFCKGHGMTKKTKIKIMVMVTLLMSVGFIMMNQVPVGRVVLVLVWIFHLIYFTVGVKTIKQQGCLDT